MTKFNDWTANDMKVMGCRGCCNYPNGKLGIAAICVAVLGFVLAIPASHGCRYFKQPVSSTRNFYFGLFSYQDSTGTCTKWSASSDFETSWSFARAMAILATVTGAIALAFTLSLSCVSMPNLILKIMSVAYLVSGLCLILTLVANADCYECSLAGGGIMAIITPIIYLATAVLIFKIPLYKSDGLPNTTTKKNKVSEKQQDQVTITIMELPDGTKKTIKTTIDEFGNKTIEETLEAPQEEEEVEEEVTFMPDGSIKRTRITFDEDGAKVIHETIEKPAQV